MKRLPFYFWASLALASCQGGKEAVNQALPVIDMNEDYPEKEIVLQDIADIRKEFVRMLQFDDLFGQHLEHIAEHLDASPLSYAVRTQSALEETAHLAFHINKENGKYGVQSHNAHPDNDTFYEYSQSLRHDGG